MKRKLLITLIVVAIATMAGFGVYELFIKQVDTQGETLNNTDNDIPDDTIEEFKPIDECTPFEALDQAKQVVNEALSFETNTIGEVAVKTFISSTNQSVDSSRIKENDILFSQSISLSSMKEVASQMYLKEGSYLYRNATQVDEDSCTWSDEIQSFSDTEFANNFGRMPTGLSKYILTEDSIIESSFIGTDADGNYIYYYAVDTTKALTDYSKEIKYRSGSSIVPEFEYANMTLTMTDQFIPLTIRYSEKYKLKVIVNVTCVLDNTETFTGFNDSEIDENIKNIFTPYVNTTTFEKRQYWSYV